MLTLDWLTDARRRCGSLDHGEPYEAAESAADLITANALLRAMQGTLIGGPLVSKAVSASGTGYSGFAYAVSTLSAAVTLTTPSPAREGQMFSVADAGQTFDTHHLTLTGTNALIEGDGTLILSTVDDSRAWFYRADTANWERFRDLTLDDTVWLPDALSDALTWMLSARLAPVYGLQITDATGKPGNVATRSAEGEAMIRLRFGRKGK